MPPHQIRISRTVSDLPRAIKSYTEGLGMVLLWETTSNDGALHALLGYPDAAWHLDLSLPPPDAGLDDKGSGDMSTTWFRNSDGTTSVGTREPVTASSAAPPSPRTSRKTTIPSELAEPQPVGNPASLDVLFQLYIPDATEWSTRCTAMAAAGWEEVEPVRQYVTLPGQP